MTDIRFALAQIDTCVGDLDSNADKVMRYAHLAAQQGAQVVVFPEMTLTGYPIEDLALRATFRKAAWDKANWLATELASDSLGELYVVVGTVGTDRETSKPRNRLVVLHDGVVWAGYDKHFLPNYGVFDEFRIFSPGNKSMVLDMNGARIGVAICEDIWQDGGPVAELAKENIDLLLTMNGSPYEEGKTDTRLDLAVRRAAEVNAPMIYLNQVGGQDDLVFDGGSFVVDTNGTLLERSPMFMEDLSFFDLDTSVEHQKVGMIAAKPDPDEEVYTACVLGLKDYMAKNHFKGVCLGLSGGIDSALVAAMAADAVGGENVYGISMPSMYSSDGSKDDAADLARNIGAHYDIQPIEPLFVSFQNQLELEASPPRTCRRASAASSSWPTRTPKDCWPWPPATSPNWHAAIPQSTAMRSAAMRRSRTCSRPACGDLPLAQQGCRRRHGHRRSACRRQRAGERGHSAAGWCDDPRQLDREGAVRRITPRAEGFRFAAGIRAARSSIGDVHRACSWPRRPAGRRLRRGDRRHGHAIGRPRRMEASPVSAGTEGDGAGVWT